MTILHPPPIDLAAWLVRAHSCACRDPEPAMCAERRGESGECGCVCHGGKQGPPPHPYWCDDCGGKAPFTIPGCPIEHSSDCPRHGEDAMEVYKAAVESVRRTGKAIE